jgi:signal transduction histidine kinase
MPSAGLRPGDHEGAAGLPLPVVRAAPKRNGGDVESPVGPRIGERPAKDLSERLRRVECERDAALDANRAKDAFLADLSHEFRSPLHVMISWMALLRAGTLNSGMQQHALEVIERNLRAQAVLVDDLLDVARIATGKLTIEPVPVDLATIVSTAVDDHRLVADAQGVALEGPSPGEPLIVHGDARLLAQVVANLLTNALKFTPEGGAVRVALVPESAGVVLEIRDTGDGIAPELLPHVFDRLRQGHARNGRSRGGLGLGLAIAKHLVEEQGGSITAASEGDGRGALFRVTLPRGGVLKEPVRPRHRAAG